MFLKESPFKSLTQVLLLKKKQTIKYKARKL